MTRNDALTLAVLALAGIVANHWGKSRADVALPSDLTGRAPATLSNNHHFPPFGYVEINDSNCPVVGYGEILCQWSDVKFPEGTLILPPSKK